jgi:sec-independent protein translocase protein TatA
MFSGLENPTHLLFIVVIALIVLGPKRLPDAGRALGSGLRNFKDAISGETRNPNEDASTVTAAADLPADPRR